MTATPSSPPPGPDIPDHEGAAPSNTSTGGAFAVPGREAEDRSVEADADAADIAELKARVYSRTGASSPDADADRTKLAEWERMRAETEATARGLRERDAAPAPHGAESEVEVLLESTPDFPGGETHGETREELHEGARRSRRIMLVTVAVSLLTGVVVAGAVSRFVADVHPSGALAIFTRPVTDDDSLTGSLRFTTLAGSEVAASRRLADTYGWEFWAVRTDDAGVCLYAERREENVSACAIPAAFEAAGVAITLPDSYAQSSAYSTATIGRPVTLSWGPEDTALTFVSAG